MQLPLEPQAIQHELVQPQVGVGRGILVVRVTVVGRGTLVKVTDENEVTLVGSEDGVATGVLELVISLGFLTGTVRIGVPGILTVVVSFLQKYLGSSSH